MREAFAHYVSPAVIERLAEDPVKLVLGGEARTLTIMFCDVRGFTAMAERLDAQEPHPVYERVPDLDERCRAGAWRHHRQVYWRRHHGVLERAPRRSAIMPAMPRRRLWR